MNRKKIETRIRYGLQYVPLTLNCLLLAAAAFWCFRKLKVVKLNPDSTSSFAPFLNLMGKTTLFFLLSVVAFCLISVLVCYFQLLWIRKRKGLFLSLDFDHADKKQKIHFQASIDSVRRPWLGTVRSRLVYDDGMLTSKLNLQQNLSEKGKFFRKGILGKQAIELPDIKTYQLSGAFIYFEDLLHLFSFAVFVPRKGHFFQPPQNLYQKISEERPQQVVTDEIRVEESKPIQGDFLNYKNFEGGDDIRRIVWQVYAKNRELVVRIPEMRDFYASHLSFFASFYTGLKKAQYENVFGAEMLNSYKNRIWTAIDIFLAKGIPINFHPDQTFQTGEISEQRLHIQMALSNAVWQSEKDLQDYFRSGNKGILFISSLNEPASIEQTLNTAGRDTVVYFVLLSHTFRHWISWGWFKRIFMKSPVDRLKRIRSRWPLSPLRYTLLKREKVILKLLEGQDTRYVVLK